MPRITQMDPIPCMAGLGAEILSLESLLHVGKKCHELLSSRPELQTLLHANGGSRSLLVELCVYGLLRAQVPPALLKQPKGIASQPQQHPTHQRVWVCIRRAEVSQVMRMSIKDLNACVMDQLATVRCACSTSTHRGQTRPGCTTAINASVHLSGKPT